ncbi:MAG: DUF262 domain-containing protein [Thermoleophilia bacterium]
MEAAGFTEERVVKISAIIDNVNLGTIALPEFQRGYVWNRDQVRGFMQSLYRRYPVGSLLVWVTETSGAQVKGSQKPVPGYVSLLLDGQQRVTTLYGILEGKEPPFFEGKPAILDGLRFNVDQEIFEYYGPVKMKDDPLWVDVTGLMQLGLGPVLAQFLGNERLKGDFETYLERLNRLYSIRDLDLHVEEITGPDKDLDVVVEIFNRVNSAGTKLSKGDLALAKVCAQWPDARKEMRRRLDKWKKAGFDFELDWLLRNINTLITGEAKFSALEQVGPEEFQAGLSAAEKHIDYLLNLISSRLGLDHDRVLAGRYAFPVLTRYLAKRGGSIADPAERDRLLFWYIHSFLWGRYTSSTESTLNKDLAVIDVEGGETIERLIGQLRINRGDLTIYPSDFSGWSLGARFYPLLYSLVRTFGARDWLTEHELSGHLLGKLSKLEIHHIFPKALLYQHGYERADVNSLANFAFLTQESNITIGDRPPADYLKEIASKDTGLLASQWVPLDPELWQVHRYRDFLQARRELLAKGANDFLSRLYEGDLVRDATPARSILEQPAGAWPSGGSMDSGEEEELLELLSWVEERGLPLGEIMYELSDADSGMPLAILDVAWPEGIQTGLSQPVCVLLQESDDVEQAANEQGFRFFRSIESFKKYVSREVLGSRAPVS